MKKIFLLLLIVGIAVSFIGCNPEGTTKQDLTAEIQSITKGADRLLVLQNANGSWDWIVTTATGPTATTYYNQAGVNGQGLLAAYEVTKDTRYLVGAEAAANYIVGTAISNTQRQNHAGILLLYSLNLVDGNAVYKTHADAIMTSIITSDNNTFTLYDTDGIVGISPSELQAALISYRSGNPGLVPWDLYKYVKDSQYYGNSAYGTTLANLIKSYVSPSLTDYKTLGIAAVVMALKYANMDFSTELANLQAQQNADGTFIADPIAEGIVQTTSYSIMALVAAGDNTNALKGVEALMTRGSNGVWVETDTNEYSEVDAEVILAIAAYVLANQ